MKRKLAFSKTLFVFTPLCIASTVVVIKTMGLRYWWFGFLLAQALQFYFQSAVFRGQAALMRLGTERIAINLRALKISRVPKIFGFQWRFGLIIALVAMTFMATIHTDVERGFNEITRILKPEELLIRIEYPAWVEATPAQKKMGSTPIELQADAASYLELNTHNLKNGSWHVLFRALREGSTETQGQPFSLSIGKESVPRWGQSFTQLLELLGADKTTSATVVVEAKHRDGSISLARIRVAPIALPQVSLNSASNTKSEAASPPTLPFLINVQSRIPLSTILLEARTKSGYKFTKTVAEYAGRNELLIKNQSANLPTMGVPFAPDDILFVKAVAKTIVSGIDGNSNEIAIPVKSREEIQKQLREHLETVLKLLDQGREPIENLKRDLQRELFESENIATSLGRQSFARRKISESKQFVERIKTRQDINSQSIRSRVKSIIESLKRSANTQEASSLLSRLQNLRNNIQKSASNNLPELSSEVESLSRSATELQKKLSGAIQDPSFGLTPEEKNTAQNLLSSNKTPEKIQAVAAPLKEKQREVASKQAAAAIDEAQRKLGGTLQMIMAARQRSIKIARENLQEADSLLQNSRSKSAEQAEKEIQSGQERLHKVPKLGQDFDQALSEAQTNTSRAKDSSHNNNTQQMREHLDGAQESIAKALEELSDQEQQEREDQRDADSMEQRTAQDLISTQGELDAGWRKLILEEISRLRTKGEPADSSLLKFLESRLR